MSYLFIFNKQKKPVLILFFFLGKILGPLSRSVIFSVSLFFLFKNFPNSIMNEVLHVLEELSHGNYFNYTNNENYIIALPVLIIHWWHAIKPIIIKLGMKKKKKKTKLSCSWVVAVRLKGK